METPTKEYLEEVSAMNIPEINEINEINGKQLDIIATNVNRTIQDLNLICHEIGYSNVDISLKKSEIFQVLEETIQNFTGNLEREKESIINECEWLRQQIRIILSMVNDTNGTKLSEMNRGIVFQDWESYDRGYKLEIEKKLNCLKTRRDDFYEDSPFNISNNHEINLEKTYEKKMNEKTPSLTLLQNKNKLNSIFLDVLKIFIKNFKKFNTLHLKLIEIMESLGEENDINPPRKDSEYHRELIEQFENTIKCLRLSDNTSSFALNDNDNVQFIVSSPKKGKPQPRDISNTSSDIMNDLRDINYNIVRVIRSLNFTKIDHNLIQSINDKISHYEIQLNERTSKMNTIINQCFDIIENLQFNDEQLMNIQKFYSDQEGGYFDLETLKFIQLNPKEFGLNTVHLNFIENFQNLLLKIKQSKEKKWNYYYTNCSKLWEKLNEDNAYIDNFVNCNSNLTDNSIINFKMELNRLMTKRSKNIDKFIIDTKNEINSYWDKLYYTEDQKKAFKHYQFKANFDESFDKEVILNDHETELSNLKEEYNNKKLILEEYEQLNELLKDKEFLMESSKDSSRLLSKNSCKILLNEERIRKKLLKTLPKLISDLKAKVVEYNNHQLSNEGRTFTIHNEDFFEKLLLIENQQVKSRPLRRKSPVKSTKTVQKPNAKPRSVPNRRRIVATLESSPFKETSRLKPLQSPLLPHNMNYSPNTNVPSKLSPKLSPLRYNLSPTISTTSFKSPGSVRSTPEDKENITFDIDLGLTPIKVSDLNWDKTSTPTRSSIARSSIARSSMGDIMSDYQQWREERLRN
ncbi:hypothetical protein CLIB1444_01S12112 [[Candida] jaroonii]|uniref:Uncharacterized protein n=1 Tax=[Candida] jaroonii TaxID=467808 RepID=A0ACA9Y153_9ASCO|nr:hypothetical protein CLIB1444_01S12112 [[Candida] jaroonii]